MPRSVHPNVFAGASGKQVRREMRNSYIFFENGVPNRNKYLKNAENWKATSPKPGSL